MSTYNQLLHEYRKDLKEKDIPAETLKVFLFELCSEYDTDLYMEMDEEARPDIEKRYREGVKRILNNEPLNYILGYSWFFGYRMKVNGDVLIPRPETEELLGHILSCVDEDYPEGKVSLADVGTGSGALAVALKKEEDRLEVYASDISEKALEVAKENALDNGADVTFLQGDMLEPFIERELKLDILVSNPPYIPEEEEIEASVKDFEPHVALFGGKDGLYFYRRIFEKAHLLMKEKGRLFFEIGYDQAERLKALAGTYYPDAKIEVFKDINRKDRMLKISL